MALLLSVCAAFAGKAEDGELNETTSETHCFTRSRRPDIDTSATHHAAGIRDNILAAVGAGLKPDARTQRQIPWVSRDDSFRNHLSAGRSTTQTVRGRNVSGRRNDVVLFDGNLSTK